VRITLELDLIFRTGNATRNGGYFFEKSDSQFHLCVDVEAKWEPKVFHKNKEPPNTGVDPSWLSRWFQDSYPRFSKEIKELVLTYNHNSQIFKIRL
jgi:hypothetical protein